MSKKAGNGKERIQKMKSEKKDMLRVFTKLGSCCCCTIARFIGKQWKYYWSFASSGVQVSGSIQQIHFVLKFAYQLIEA